MNVVRKHGDMPCRSWYSCWVPLPGLLRAFCRGCRSRSRAWSARSPQRGSSRISARKRALRSRSLTALGESGSRDFGARKLARKLARAGVAALGERPARDPSRIGFLATARVGSARSRPAHSEGEALHRWRRRASRGRPRAVGVHCAWRLCPCGAPYRQVAKTAHAPPGCNRPRKNNSERPLAPGFGPIALKGPLSRADLADAPKCCCGLPRVSARGCH